MFDRKSRIIKDGASLSFDYVPETLHCREQQMKDLENMFGPLAIDGRTCSAFLWGGVGSGKTVTAKRFCMDMERYFFDHNKRMATVYINCRLKATEYAAALEMIRYFDKGFPDRGFALDEILTLVRRNLEKERLALVVILDEADVLLKGTSKNLIYQLSRFSEGLGGGSSLSLIMISQYPIAPMLDEASMSTFRRANTVNFPRYTNEELRIIVRYRADIALDADTLLNDGLDLIARNASDMGDARFAIEVLERAAHIAEGSGSEIVDLDSIRTASSSIYSDVSEVKLGNLDKNKQIALLAIARAIKTAPSVSITKCEKTYAVVCEEYNVPAKKHTQFYTYVQDMDKQNILRTEVKREADGGRVTYIGIDNIPPKELAKKLEYLLEYKETAEQDLE